ncbi:hypothetical protein GCM10022235_61040 [Kribbella ginsengisoli]|uniref:Uncharacterized protein n=1 Tax=Kribbella ginsengisoli TaxID=363865 RepID=A0ABP6YH71_9ACTN
MPEHDGTSAGLRPFVYAHLSPPPPGLTVRLPLAPLAMTMGDFAFTLLHENQWGWGNCYVEYQVLETKAQA